MYPASGYRSTTSGAFGVMGSEGRCWSCRVINANGYNFSFTSIAINPMNNANRGVSYGVRCVQYLLFCLRLCVF